MRRGPAPCLSVWHAAQEILWREIEAHLCGQLDKLPAALPFRNFVAQSRLGVRREEHESSRVIEPNPSLREVGIECRGPRVIGDRRIHLEPLERGLSRKEGTERWG